MSLSACSCCSSDVNWFNNLQLLFLAEECTTYLSLTSGDQKTTYTSITNQCDRNLKGWYRFQGAAGTRMPTSCTPKHRCSTGATGWLNGSHPTVADGKVSRQVCFSYTVVGEPLLSANHLHSSEKLRLLLRLLLQWHTKLSLPLLWH